jgi:hypothetical protein
MVLWLVITGAVAADQQAKPRQLNLENKPWKGDFDQMLERRMIRVLMPYSGEIGVANGLVKSSEAAPLVGGAMLTVILYPVVALRLTGQSIDHATARLNDRDGL